MDQFAAYIAAHKSRYFDELNAFLRQPSIAAQGIGMEATAMLVAQRLEQLGADVQIIRLPNAAPIVYGSVGAGTRTLLVYDHYDVQPPEPLHGWQSPPFEPSLRYGRLYARGAADNKGNLMLRLQAIEAWLKSVGPLPLRINFLIEGEEEIGSVHLKAFTQEYGRLLQADGCLWETGGRIATGQQTIHCGGKGMYYVELVARGAAYDLHSANGTVVPNPAWRLVWALNTLKTPDEHIAIPGFYDSVRPPSAADLQALESIPLDDDLLLADYQIPAFLRKLRGIERIKAHLFEPTCTICGIVSGYTGVGTKTVLPSEARAKLDFRLVPDQDPEEIRSQLRAHLDANGFEDIIDEVEPLSSVPASRSDPNAAVVQAMRRAIAATYGEEPVVYPTMAATGPMYTICDAFGTPVTSGCGVGHQGSLIHAPNENIRMDDYWLAMRCMGAFIQAFGEM